MTLKSQQSTLSQGLFRLFLSLRFNWHQSICGQEMEIRPGQLSLKTTPLWSVMGYLANGVSYCREKLLGESLDITYYFPLGFLYWMKAFFVGVKSGVIPVTFQKVINIELEYWKLYLKWDALGSKSFIPLLTTVFISKTSTCLSKFSNCVIMVQ